MDLLLDENDDLSIIDGDFEIGEDTQQRVQLILQASQGHFKQYPLCGVGLQSALGGGLTSELKQKIQLQLQSDGLALSSVTLIGLEVNVELR